MSRYFNPREYECWITGPQPTERTIRDPRKLTQREGLIYGMHKKRWTTTRISTYLGINERTVTEYIRKAEVKIAASKP
jgi:DNA-binding NarL/FixJ family response regulator